MTNAREPSTLRFRVGFFLVALLIVGIVIVLPFAIRSLIDDLYSSVEGDVYPFDGTATSQDALWDFYQNEAPDSFAGSARRLAYLARLLGRTGKVLNIGVGAGTFEAAALARGLTVFSLDPSAASIERLRQRLGLGDRAQVGYGQRVPFPDRSFDALVLSEVMEHLSDEVLEATLKEAARVLRPGGRLVGTVPAREDLAANTVICPDCGRRFHRWGHSQSFDPGRDGRSLAGPSGQDLTAQPRARR